MSVKFRDSQVPPLDAEPFAKWRGRLLHPTAEVTLSPREHAAVCVGGWIASSEWHLRCTTCRKGSS